MRYMLCFLTVAGVALGARAAAAQPAEAVLAPPSAVPFGQHAFRETDPGVQMPKPTHTPKPVYPAGPLRARIRGTVKMELVVLSDGKVGDVRVVGSVDPELDKAAIACARQWRFKPGTKDGQPAAVVVELNLSFRRTR